MLLIIRSKQNFGSSSIDHVSKTRKGLAESWLCRKECTASSSKAFSCKALQELGDYCTTPGQHSTSSLPPAKRNLSQEQQSPLTPPLASRGNCILQEPCRASGAAFLAQTVFNLEHNDKLDLQTLGKIPRSACRFLLHSYNKGLDSLPGFPQFHKEPLPQLHNNSKDFTKH